MKLRIILLAGFLCLTAGFAAAKGDAAVAEQYVIWAENAIAAGQWSQARAALERAADFDSSDIFWLLAVTRSRDNESRALVLQALEKAIGIGQWRRYTEAQARLFQAEQLITLRRYYAALDSLAVYRALAGDNADSAVLRLAALKGLVNDRPGMAMAGLPIPAEFRRRMLETLDRYPRDPRPVRILFDYALTMKAAGQKPGNDLALLDIALKRLPFLLDSEPELAWMAAHFIGDDAEARRLVAAYRAAGTAADSRPNPASLVPALNLGLIDDMDAVEALFSESVLDKDLIITISVLLRSEEGRDALAEKLHAFTGTITEDADRDGYAESRAVYRQGSLQEYYSDFDQDGIADLSIMFIAGVPQRAELLVKPPVLPVSVLWERFPSVQQAVLDAETFLFAPGHFHFAPIGFVELGASDRYNGLMFPQRDSRSSGLNRRMLASFAFTVQRPSAEFTGGVERVYLERGKSVRAEVTLNDMLVAVTEFENGIPVIQRLDMDLDGRMDTVRRFRQSASGDQALIRSSESDWHGDGSFRSTELYQKDGSVIYLWDLDGDGKYDYSETRK